MRGKGSVLYIAALGIGITPACAGKSSRNETCWHRPWDHPCVCREKIEMPYELLLKEGSPPRVRGKDDPAHPVAAPAGITPACAGKSPPESDFAGHRWDHPRVCGEKAIIDALKRIGAGSPPRMRGKASRVVRAFSLSGITPACAGKR